MTTDDGSPGRLYLVLDAFVYAVAVTVLVLLAAVAVSAAIGGGWLVVEYVLFVVGILVFGYATFQLRPEPPWKTRITDDGELAVTRTDRRSEGVESEEESRFQSALQRVPPLRSHSVPPDERISAAAKLFLASLAVLATSLAVERLLLL